MYTLFDEEWLQITVTVRLARRHSLLEWEYERYRSSNKSKVAKDYCTSVHCTSVGIWATVCRELVAMLENGGSSCPKILGWKQCALSADYTFPSKNIFYILKYRVIIRFASANVISQWIFVKPSGHDCHITVLVNVTLPLSYASYIATRLIGTLWILHSTIIYVYT